MATNVERLPYGIGRLSRGWVVLILGLLALIGLGIFAYSRQWVAGLVVTGLRDIGTMRGSTWGLYITFDIYFVGVSFAGVTIAALIRLLNLKHLRPVSRMAELLTIVSLIAAGLVILPDLGQPVRGLINLFRYARPESPFFGTFTLVISGYLFGSLVYFYLDGRRDAARLAQVPSRLRWLHRLWAAGYQDTLPERARHERASFWLAVAILPLLVTAHSTLGFVFGLQVGRPGWFSALQAPAFVIMAGVSGVGMLLVIAAILRRVLNLQQQLPPAIFGWLGNLMMVLILAYLYFMVTDWLTATYAAEQHEVRITTAMLFGEYAWLFWSVVGTLVVSFGVLALPYLPWWPAFALRPATQLRFARLARAAGGLAVAILALTVVFKVPGPVQTGIGTTAPFAAWLPWVLLGLLVLYIALLLPRLRQDAIARAVAAGVLVNVGAILKRFLIVVPSQTHGTLLPYMPGSYAPTWVEYGVILGLLALAVLLYAVFVKVFPILEMDETEAAVAPRRLSTGRKRLRTGLAVLMVFGGFALQGVSYFFLAAPLGIPTSEVFSNPRLPFAPAIFILGVMVVFLAAVVYELLPDQPAPEYER